MTNKQQTYCKNRLATWLLTIAMLSGVFAFSGYNNNSTLLNNVKVRTELVCSTKAIHKKFTVAFKKVISTSYRHPFLNYFGDSTTLLLAYNKLIKVKFDHTSRVYQSIDQEEKFAQLKNIPSNSSKDIFISIG
ncbi:MAG: hypothetical protein ABIN01_01100 [Ferruginibacter sp.]